MQLCGFDSQKSVLFLPKEYRHTFFRETPDVLVVNDNKHMLVSVYPVPGHMEAAKWLTRKIARYNLGAELYDDKDLSVIIDARSRRCVFSYPEHHIVIPKDFLPHIKICGCKEVAVVQKPFSIDVWEPSAYEQFYEQAGQRYRESTIMESRRQNGMGFRLPEVNKEH